MNSSGFVKHIPCLECGSRDNRAVYDDGHEYCFGCKDRTDANRTLQSIKDKLTNKVVTRAGVLDLSSYTTVIRADAISWLAKYQITPQEIQDFKILWNPNEERLAFCLGKPETMVTNERSFSNPVSKSKYKTKGAKAGQIFIFDSKSPSPPDSTIVLVEDVVSAIKVARVVDSCPILGSHIPTETLAKLSRIYKHIKIWLDYDKARDSINFKQLASQFFESSDSIITPLDPKEYTTEKIKLCVHPYDDIPGR
jgi:hypothetical protein